MIKGLAAGLAYGLGLLKVVGAVRRARTGGARVLILSYHRVVEDFRQEVARSIPGLLTSRETFGRHLEALHCAGYELTSLEDALEILGGRRKSSRSRCVITFDDGYRDVFRHAAPILRRKGIPAVIYVPSGFIGTDRRFIHDRLHRLVGLASERRLKAVPDEAAALLEPLRARRSTPSEALDRFIAPRSSAELEAAVASLERALGGGSSLLPEGGEVMSWDEVRALAAQGFEIGSHTVGHTVLTNERPCRIDEEIGASKAAIEREIGKEVAHFAYCNGWYSAEVVRALIRHGFRSAVTTEDLPNAIGVDPFALKRKVLWENFSIGALGTYSASLTACQLEDLFGFVGVRRPVLGLRSSWPVRAAEPAEEGSSA